MIFFIFYVIVNDIGQQPGKLPEPLQNKELSVSKLPEASVMSKESYLFSIIEKERLEKMLDAFYECIGIPIQVIDQYGQSLMRRGQFPAFCRPFQEKLTGESSCQAVHLKASQSSVAFGGSYIFSCHANLNHIAYPFVSRGAFLGAALAGPFLMEKPDSMLILDIAKSYRLPLEELLSLYDDSIDIPQAAPSRAAKICDLLSFLFDGLITDNNLVLLTNQSKLAQQSRINESIQRYKTSGIPSESSYPYKKERELIVKVKTGNSKEAKHILNDLLGYILLSEGNNLDAVRVRAMELSSLLSRAAIEGGAPADQCLDINNQFLQSAHGILTIDNLCLQLQEIVDAFTKSMFHQIPDKNGDVIRKAFSYIADNYHKNITLQDVADHVHLNAAYFSSVFKRSSGFSFKEYLNMVRIEESKRLLSNTDYSIIDIAVATGFEDQSYFARVFKRYTGLTPRQYR